jgi:hypothetical protein
MEGSDEAQAASALNHPNICTIHDIGEENGRALPDATGTSAEHLSAKHGTAGSPSA